MTQTQEWNAETEQDERERELWQRTVDLRAAVSALLREAGGRAAEADAAVADLCSARVYDVEYAEGVGADIAEHVRVATLHLRAAQALAATVVHA